MSKMSFVTDMILDTFKRVLVRFKNAKFGLLFFKYFQNTRFFN